jgi:hypothetical protein
VGELPLTGRWRHLAKRFAGSLRPGGPSPADDVWARSLLTEREGAVWDRQSPADRRHAVGVARATAASLGPDATRPVMAAALLHDAGKVHSGLGTFGRVGATLAGIFVGRSRIGGRAGTYLRHDALGADLLAAAHSDPLTIAWAREHHLAPERWTLDRRVASALKAADDD